MSTGDAKTRSWTKTTPFDEEAHVVIQQDEAAVVALSGSTGGGPA